MYKSSSTGEELDQLIIDTVPLGKRDKAREMAQAVNRGQNITFDPETGSWKIKVEKWQDAAYVSEEEFTRQIKEGGGKKSFELMDDAVRDTWEQRGLLSEDKTLYNKPAEKPVKGTPDDTPRKADITVGNKNTTNIVNYYKREWNIPTAIEVQFGRWENIATGVTEGNKKRVVIKISKDAKNPYAILRSELEHVRDIAKKEVPDQKVKHFSRYEGINEEEMAYGYVYKKSKGNRGYKEGKISQEGVIDTNAKHMNQVVKDTWARRGWLGSAAEWTVKTANSIARHYVDKWKLNNKVKVEFVDGLQKEGKTVDGDVETTTFLGKKAKKEPQLNQTAIDKKKLQIKQLQDQITMKEGGNGEVSDPLDILKEKLRIAQEELKKLSTLPKEPETIPEITIKIDKNAKNPYAELRIQLERARDIAKGELPDKSKGQLFSRYEGVTTDDMMTAYIDKKAQSGRTISTAERRQNEINTEFEQKVEEFNKQVEEYNAKKEAEAAVETPETKAESPEVNPDDPEIKAQQELVKNIAQEYANMLGHQPDKFHMDFVNALINKDYNYLINLIATGKGLNEASKKMFSKYTGIKLPSTIEGKKDAILDWAEVDKEKWRNEQKVKAEAEKAKIEEEKAKAKAEQEKAENEKIIKEIETALVNYNGKVVTYKEMFDDLKYNRKGKLIRSTKGRPVYKILLSDGSFQTFSKPRDRKYIDMFWGEDGAVAFDKPKEVIKNHGKDLDNYEFSKKTVDTFSGEGTRVTVRSRENGEELGYLDYRVDENDVLHIEYVRNTSHGTDYYERETAEKLVNSVIHDNWDKKIIWNATSEKGMDFKKAYLEKYPEIAERTTGVSTKEELDRVIENDYNTRKGANADEGSHNDNGEQPLEARAGEAEAADISTAERNNVTGRDNDTVGGVLQGNISADEGGKASAAGVKGVSDTAGADRVKTPLDTATSTKDILSKYTKGEIKIESFDDVHRILSKISEVENLPKTVEEMKAAAKKALSGLTDTKAVDNILNSNDAKFMQYIGSKQIEADVLVRRLCERLAELDGVEHTPEVLLEIDSILSLRDNLAGALADVASQAGSVLRLQKENYNILGSVTDRLLTNTKVSFNSIFLL